jgi:hypothetical protein
MMKENNIINPDVMIQFMFPSLTPSVEKSEVQRRLVRSQEREGAFFPFLNPTLRSRRLMVLLSNPITYSK